MEKPLGAGGRRNHHKFSQRNIVELQSARGETLITAALGVRHVEAHTKRWLSYQGSIALYYPLNFRIVYCASQTIYVWRESSLL